MTATERKPRPAAHRGGDARTEAAILGAAEKIFSDKGFFDATVADIVSKAGVSRGTFYFYFQDREDVFLALLTTIVDEMFVLPAEHGGSFEDRVERANRSYLEAFRNHGAFMRCALQMATYNQDASTALNDLRGRFLERLRSHLERAKAAGRCHDFDVRIASYAIVMMVEFFAYSWLSFGWNLDEGDFEFEAVAKELSAMWCRAIYKPSVS
ncbi:MAG: TetR/AcrR family transcriptional regulator [Minwuia sp.]|uniref:TetR/AcrR family transcriptional regulator n=1 Tax=Minwuia sp. TaxID=2493630 RepID=UPI003A85C2EC